VAVMEYVDGRPLGEADWPESRCHSAFALRLVGQLA